MSHPEGEEVESETSEENLSTSQFYQEIAILDFTPAHSVSSNEENDHSSDLGSRSSTPCIPVLAQKDFTKLGTTVRQVLSHPTLGPKFRAFARKFHADEGIQFLDELSVAPEDHVEDVCKRLMERFFIEGAPNWVNLPNVLHKDLLQQYSEHKFTSVAQLFDGAMYETFTDLKNSDTFRKFCLEDEEAKAFAFQSSTLLLDTFVTPENFHKAVRPVHKDEYYTNLIRFAASVSEFDRKTKAKDRKTRGNKILAMFIQAGAPYQVELPSMYAEGIRKGNFDKVLVDARMEILQKLSHCEALMAEARKYSVTAIAAAASAPPAVTPHHERDAAHALLRKSEKTTSVNTSKMNLEIASMRESHHLEMLLDQPLKWKELIARNQVDSLVANKLRFLSAIKNYLELPPSSSKVATGRKIVSTFVSPGSSFEVADLAPGFVHDLLQDKLVGSVLPVVFHQVLADLAIHPDVIASLANL